MVYGTGGAVALGAPAPTKAGDAHFRKYNADVEDEPRVPKGNPGGGQWTTGGGETQVAAAGDLKCEGLPYGGCEAGDIWENTAIYRIFGRNLCRDCAVKSYGLRDESHTEQTRILRPRLILE
jgi:hypothetical protein